MTTRAIWYVLAIAATACGGGGGDDNPPDANEQIPDAQELPDAGDIDATVLLPDAAGTDALPACAPQGDYVEADDAGNDILHTGTEETSGITMSGTEQTFGGCIDPAYADAGDPPVQDADTFAFETGAVGWVSGRITSPQGAAADGGTVLVVDGNFNVIASATLVGGEALIPPAYITAGTNYLLIVDSATTAIYTYQVELRTYVCALATDPADYTEANDGASSRDNDMFGVTWGPDTLTATALATDAPEATGTTVTGGNVNRVRLDGVSADIASDGDEYLDRDTFVFRTAGTIRRLAIHVAWNKADNDLDFLVLPEDQIDIDAVVGFGTAIGGQRERTGMIVDPMTRYWIWVGDYTGSVPTVAGLPYTVTICGFE